MPRPTKQQLADVARMMSSTVAEAARLPDARVRALAPVLQQARAELQQALAAWLATHPDGSERFTAQRYRAAIVALDSGIQAARERLDTGVADVLVDGLTPLSSAAIRHMTEQIGVMSSMFGESLRPVSLDRASIVAEGKKALIPRFRTSAARYARGVADDIKRQLSIGLVSGETFHEMTSRLVKLGGPKGLVYLRGLPGEKNARAEWIAEGMFERYRHTAERVVRTEAMQGYNSMHDQAIRDADRQDPGYSRRWDASEDRRVCPICGGLDGAVAAIGKPFPGGYEHAPAHPRCRCCITSWRAEWGDTRVLTAGAPVPSYAALSNRPRMQQTLRLRADQTRDLARRVLDIEGKPIAPTSPERMESIRSVFRRGQKAVDDLGRVRVIVGADGVLEIEDGRHRLLTAAEFPNIKLKVTYARGI